MNLFISITGVLQVTGALLFSLLICTWYNHWGVGE